MKIHHLNCMSFQKIIVPEITHCLLVETKAGLILVDAGLGLADHQKPTFLEAVSILGSGVKRDLNETALRQVAKLGYDPKDVREIVPTHLHFDHIGGAMDFPWATVHVWEQEWRAALQPQGMLGTVGYFPEMWRSHSGLKIHPLGAECWFGLPAIPLIAREDVEIWLVPLVGHSPGMCGVAIRHSSRSDWLLHCGDAYVRTMQVHPTQPESAFPAVARSFEQYVFPSSARALIQRLLREHGAEITAFCSHDPQELAQLRA